MRRSKIDQKQSQIAVLWVTFQLMQVPKRLSLPQTQRLKLLTGERKLLTEETSLERVDLTCCKAVEFELRDEVPRVRFLADEHEGWTPVVRRRRKQDLPSPLHHIQSPTHPLTKFLPIPSMPKLSTM